VANEIQQAELNAEGDRVSADFGLGQRTGAWSRRKRSASFGCGCALLFVLSCVGFLPFIPTPAPWHQVIWGVCGATLLLAILLMARSRSWQERLFQYDQGIAEFAGREPEPTVLRWADLAALSLRVVTSYESHSLMSCVLRDSAGRTITVESGYGLACESIAAAAERMLGQRLAPTLIARCGAGEPVTFGHIIVDRAGISCPGDGSAKPWNAYWRDTRSIEMLMHAHRLTITPHSGRARSVSLDGAPNDFLAGYVIAHAAGQAGVVVTAH
jgi:hypothetical protein